MPDISLLGAIYPDVPAVNLPKDGGGTANFYDISDTTASASDVIEGKTFYNANGVKTVGTVSLVETDPIFSSSPAAAISTADISSWNGKSDFSGSYDDLTNKPAIPSIAADIGAVAVPSSAASDEILAYNGTSWTADKRMVILSYGHSTWNDFISAYKAQAVVYCRASTGTNPGSGAQTRLAFMAYVNDQDNPANVEFQYYRSVNAHSITQQGDQMYVYKLTNTGSWTVTVRESYTKIVAGTGLSSTYSNSTITLTNSAALPSVSSSDNGKILKVVDGAWAVVDP